MTKSFSETVRDENLTGGRQAAVWAALAEHPWGDTKTAMRQLLVSLSASRSEQPGP